MLFWFKESVLRNAPQGPVSICNGFLRDVAILDFCLTCGLDGEVPGSVLVVVVGGGAAARHSGHRLNQLRWFLLFMAASAVVTVYILIIPR